MKNFMLSWAWKKFYNLEARLHVYADSSGPSMYILKLGMTHVPVL